MSARPHLLALLSIEKDSVTGCVHVVYRDNTHMITSQAVRSGDLAVAFRSGNDNDLVRMLVNAIDEAEL